ncbi:MAG: GntR family transcriptional regulator [Caldibacillus debilis]|uniref:GntR family transcriptional regulator n=1 Tax=Caldibacillus debilis TaxID=301148 RepID=UPI000E3B4A86|nr:GntR family transcriptional regulator [Caldibacillus debilis]REJ17180.1 MAG: GntR family transcriptional regulator [Caldibacillus debilis]
MTVNFNNREPVYVQIIRYFKEQIAKGVFEPGQEIPSRRELANWLKVNPNTVQRAYKEMENQGLIFTEGNLPSRVTRDEKILRSVREELIMEAVHAFVSTVQSINVPVEEAVALVREFYGKTGEKEGDRNDRSEKY